MFNFKVMVNGLATKGEEVAKAKIVNDVIGGFADGFILTGKVGLGLAAEGAERVAGLVPVKFVPVKKERKVGVKDAYVSVVEEMISEDKIQEVIAKMKSDGNLEGLAKLYDAMRIIADENLRKNSQ